MKKFILPLIALSLFSCTKDEIIFDEITFINPIPQTIYNTSVQNHEWNDGWYSTILDNINNGGSSKVEFHCGGTYLDYDFDGDMDMFIVSEYLLDDSGNKKPNTEYTIVLLENQGLGANHKIKWKLVEDKISTQPKRIYRKVVSGDIDNDGDLDIVAFNAEDPYEGNGNRIMGGIDIFRFNDGVFTFEEVVPYSTTMHNYFHGGALGDVNGDGFIDIVSGTTSLKIFLNNNGTFTNDFIEPTEYSETGKGLTQMFSHEVFDINGDGYNDLLLGTARSINNSGYWNTYGEEGGIKLYAKHSEIFYGKPDYPYFEKEPSVILDSEYEFSTDDNWRILTWDGNMDWVITDFDDDGDYDFFTYVIRPYVAGGPSLISYYENQDNNFIIKTKEVFGYNQEFFNDGVSWLKVWDIDGDGNKEILIEESNTTGFNAWIKKNDNKYYQETITR